MPRDRAIIFDDLSGKLDALRTVVGVGIHLSPGSGAQMPPIQRELTNGNA
jgi:hypothetical protein